MKSSIRKFSDTQYLGCFATDDEDFAVLTDFKVIEDIFHNYEKRLSFAYCVLDLKHPVAVTPSDWHCLPVKESELFCEGTVKKYAETVVQKIKKGKDKG